MISQAVIKSSWDRNEAWIRKFLNYIYANCGDQVEVHGRQKFVNSITMATAFLANVIKEDPSAHTRVSVSKRAINLLRAFVRRPSLDTDPVVKILAAGARKAIVRTVRQSPALLAVFITAIIAKWGRSPTWWKKQVALMILLAFCALARGAAITSCLRTGLSWVRKDGTQPEDTISFSPVHHCSSQQCDHPQCVRGFLLLLPSRKNRRGSPSWIPVAEKSAVSLMAEHMQWLRHMPDGHYMFPARQRCRRKTRTDPATFKPNRTPDSRMSTRSLRFLIRQALVDCCGLSAQQAAAFGTHSPRIGTVEELRKCGVPSELRQQLGAWMSRTVALSYMQLNPSAQFDILNVL